MKVRARTLMNRQPTSRRQDPNAYHQWHGSAEGYELCAHCRRLLDEHMARIDRLDRMEGRTE